MTRKCQFFLILMGIVGILLILVTCRYGAGLEPDSVGYISVARHLKAGSGFTIYNDSPLIWQPPAYPIVLAFMGYISGIDPLCLTSILNAFLFGSVIYLSGYLFLKQFSSSAVFAFFGVFTVLFSKSLFDISVWAMSEILFVFFVILCFLFLDFYLKKQKITSLIFFSFAVALSCLTRYIGVVLILWGTIVILFFYRGKLKIKLIHLFLFLSISVFPTFIWLSRNYIISGTLLDSRSASTTTLYQNIYLTLNTILNWYIHPTIVKKHIILLILGLIIILSIYFSIKNDWQKIKKILLLTGPIILFIAIYTVFLIISSTVTAFDPIGNRLLSPIYMPLTLVLLVFIKIIFDHYKENFSHKFIKPFSVIIIGVWLIYLLRSTLLDVMYIYPTGLGYNNLLWRNSQTILFIKNKQKLLSNHATYSNYPEAIYIISDYITEMCPDKYNFNMSTIKNYWPRDNVSYVIWFTKNTRDYLFMMDDLCPIIKIDTLQQFKDGIIYCVAKRDN